MKMKVSAKVSLNGDGVGMIGLAVDKTGKDVLDTKLG
jgi:hypothetical protein